MRIDVILLQLLYTHINTHTLMSAYCDVCVCMVGGRGVQKAFLGVLLWFWALSGFHPFLRTLNTFKPVSCVC